MPTWQDWHDNLGSAKVNLLSVKDSMMGAVVRDDSLSAESAIGTTEGLALTKGIILRVASDASRPEDTVEGRTTEGRTSRHLLGGVNKKSPSPPKPPPPPPATFDFEKFNKDMMRPVLEMQEKMRNMGETAVKNGMVASECASKALPSKEATEASRLTPLHEPYLTENSQVALDLIAFVLKVTNSTQAEAGGPFLPAYPKATILAVSVAVSPAKLKQYYTYDPLKTNSLIGFALDIVSLMGQGWCMALPDHAWHIVFAG